MCEGIADFRRRPGTYCYAFISKYRSESRNAANETWVKVSRAVERVSERMDLELQPDFDHVERGYAEARRWSMGTLNRAGILLECSRAKVPRHESCNGSGYDYLLS